MWQNIAECGTKLFSESVSAQDEAKGGLRIHPLDSRSRQAIEIAEAAQIRYPYDPKSNFPHVMTSDFCVETTTGYVVIAVKPISELEKPRVREKLEIERRYWGNQNIRWRIITENDINRAKAKNIEWLSQSKDLVVFSLSEELQAQCTAYFLSRYNGDIDSLGRLFSNIELQFGLSPGVGINIYKHLAYWKQIDFDAAAQMDFAVYCAAGLAS